MVDIARDPRWGRIVEGAGEDPYLGAYMAAAQVRGFQGNGLGINDRIVAGPKHFVGYGAALGGRDYDEVNLSESELRNVYLPPFAAAIKAGAGNIMTSYVGMNGVPGAADRRLLTDVLRGEFGFGGFAVSDAGAVIDLTTHGFARDDHDVPSPQGAPDVRVLVYVPTNVPTPMPALLWIRTGDSGVQPGLSWRCDSCTTASLIE